MKPFKLKDLNRFSDFNNNKAILIIFKVKLKQSKRSELTYKSTKNPNLHTALI